MTRLRMCSLLLGIMMAIVMLLNPPCVGEGGGLGSARSDSGLYSIEFSQITNGASSGGSLDEQYEMVDTIQVATVSQETQAGGSYEITNPLAGVPRANSGLAIGQGTTMRLSWRSGEYISDKQGFNIYRSRYGTDATYEKVNKEPVNTSSYDDPNLSPGVYYYKVYLVDAQGGSHIWTQVFIGRIEGSPATMWSLYE